MEITPELQAVIDAAVEKATEGLKSKNKELIAREKTAKTAAEEAESAREQAEQDAAEKAGNVDAVKAGLEKKHAAELKKLTDALAERDTSLSALLIDKEISDAITANKVLPHAVPLLTKALKADAKMENGVAMADGVPLADHLSSFFKSKDASHYLEAPVNTGAGAQGSSAKFAKSMTAAEIGTAEGFERFSKIAEENPALAAKIAIDAGVPHFAPLI